MFSKLSEIPTDEAISSVYHATRALRHRPRDPKRFLSSVSRGRERSLALQLVREIERHEKVTLGDLSRAASDKYITTLAGIVLEKVKHEHPYDSQTGKRLLRELRDTPEASSPQPRAGNNSLDAQTSKAVQKVPRERIDLSLEPDIYEAYARIARDEGISVAEAIARAVVARSKRQGRELSDECVQQALKTPRRNRAR
jgi:hypothetical protein